MVIQQYRRGGFGIVVVVGRDHHGISAAPDCFAVQTGGMGGLVILHAEQIAKKVADTEATIRIVVIDMAVFGFGLQVNLILTETLRQNFGACLACLRERIVCSNDGIGHDALS